MLLIYMIWQTKFGRHSNWVKYNIRDIVVIAILEGQS